VTDVKLLFFASAIFVGAALSCPGISNAAPELRTLSHEGIAREYFAQVPMGKGAPRAVVIALHGGTRPASDIFARSAWPDVAMRHDIEAAEAIWSFLSKRR
jgi:poly(3-hydroxybutyrate) depolymerase